MTKFIPINLKENIAYVCHICHEPMTKEQSIITIVSNFKGGIPQVTYHYDCKTNQK